MIKANKHIQVKINMIGINKPLHIFKWISWKNK